MWCDVVWCGSDVVWCGVVVIRFSVVWCGVVVIRCSVEVVQLEITQNKWLLFLSV